MARALALAGSDWLRRPEWAALGVLGLLGTALTAWTVREEVQRWRWIALNRVSLAVLMSYAAGGSGLQALAWTLVILTLGLALLAVVQVVRGHFGWRVPAVLALLVLWGMPGTAGFPNHVMLMLPSELPLAAPMFVIMVIAESLFVAALWQITLGHWDNPVAGTSGVQRRTYLVYGLAFIGLALPLLWWGVYPPHLALVVGLPPNDTFATLNITLAHARRSVWIGLGVAAIAGAGLGLLRSRIFAGLRGWQAGIATVASLEWLFRGFVASLALLGNGFRYFATLGEGEGYWGWLALAGLVLWVLLRG